MSNDGTVIVYDPDNIGFLGASK